ncbi:elongation factor P [Patescibacteria group bacterium]
MVLSLKAIKPGKVIDQNGEPYLVLSAQHSKQARGSAVLKTKLKNIVSGSVINQTFQGNDKLEEASLEDFKAQYLYEDDDPAPDDAGRRNYHFMNQENYEQFNLDTEQVGSAKNYLKEEMIVTIQTHDEKPISLKLPIKIDFKVTGAEPAVKGNTAQNATKLVTIETGYKLQVPLFVDEGDVVKINTETGEYVERC